MAGAENVKTNEFTNEKYILTTVHIMTLGVKFGEELYGRTKNATNLGEGPMGRQSSRLVTSRVALVDTPLYLGDVVGKRR
jgi:hypothetical protein